MRSLEVHVFETETDLDIAVRSGVIPPEQVAKTECVQCESPICFSSAEFTSFILVIDENDQDWSLCEECASPIIDYVDAFFPPVTRSHFADPDELEFF